MKSRFAAVLVPVGALLLAGLVGRGISAAAWRARLEREPALNLEELGSALGQGLTIGVLGGFRAVVADFFWLSNNLAWERRDLAASNAMIRVVTVVDPRPIYFWINGARMMAYDMPVWRIDARGGHGVVPANVQRQIEIEQARLALGYIEQGLKHHPDNPFLLLEIGNIHLRRLNDVETAAAYYRQAAMRPGAPFYAARIHAELLRRLGRNKEALVWLRNLHPRLPKDDPMAASDVVLERIRILEDLLTIPIEERYRPAENDPVSAP